MEFEFNVEIEIVMSKFFFLAASCPNQELVSTAFTTQDATILTNIAYVSQFKLSCNGQAAVSYLTFSISYLLNKLI
jgi:hypothetical protein